MHLSDSTVSVNQLVFEVSTKFIKLSTDEIENGISETLEVMGKYFNIDRAQIFEINIPDKKISSIFSWTNNVINNQIEKFQDINLDGLSDWLDRFLNHQIVHYPDVTDYYRKEEGDVLFLRENNVKSLLAIPLIYGDRITGVMSFAAIKNHKTWNEEEIEQLKFLSEVFTNALARK